MSRSRFRSAAEACARSQSPLAFENLARRRLLGLAAGMALLPLAHRAARAAEPPAAGTAAATAGSAAAPATRPNPIAPFTGPLLVVGDSLSAEYGLKRGSGWVDLMAARLAQRKPPVEVVNASISGDTTAGGRSRLGPLLTKHAPRAVIIELGGNDALRGLDLGLTEANLRAMVAAVQATGAKAIIVGMMMPPNYGRAYADRFASIFATVANSQHAALVPFLLQGISDRLDMFQADHIHPLESAQSTLLDNVWPTVDAVLRGR